mmetsp:Transcript_11860/g.26005  ORF Transcript_11860/g.26005 Transcript_11860/m.26005 type:complete len:120 (+) Transcript_11860:2353-2712(+)
MYGQTTHYLVVEISYNFLQIQIKTSKSLKTASGHIFAGTIKEEIVHAQYHFSSKVNVSALLDHAGTMSLCEGTYLVKTSTMELTSTYTEEKCLRNQFANFHNQNSFCSAISLIFFNYMM